MFAYYLHNLDPFIFRISAMLARGGTDGLRPRLCFCLAAPARPSRRGFLDLPQAALGDFVTWVALFG